MTMLFCDSFDHYTTPLQKWDASAGNGFLLINPTAARSGTNGLELGGSSLGASLSKNIPAANAVVMGFAMNAQTGTAAIIWEGSDGSGAQVYLELSTGSLQFYRSGGTAIGPASTVVVPYNVWVYIEVKVLISATVGTVECQVNGLTAIPSTGSLNTKGSSTTNITQVTIAGPSGASAWWFDDVYVLNTSGTVNNTFLGNITVQCLMPSGNGSTNNFTNVFASWAASTVMAVGQQIKDSNGNVQRIASIFSDAKTGSTVPTWATTGGVMTTDNHVTWVVVGTGSNPGAANWMAVAEVPNDDASSYVSDSTVNDIDRYTFPASVTGTVYAVVVNLRANESAVGTRAIRAVTKSGSTLADNGSDFSLGTSFADYQGIFELDPNTSAAWLAANVNAAEFGEKVTI
jgi:hypothetical protein